jgi:hypothetical protein
MLLQLYLAATERDGGGGWSQEKGDWEEIELERNGGGARGEHGGEDGGVQEMEANKGERARVEVEVEVEAELEVKVEVEMEKLMRSERTRLTKGVKVCK